MTPAAVSPSGVVPVNSFSSAPFEFLALMRTTATPPACRLKPCALAHSAAVVFSSRPGTVRRLTLINRLLFGFREWGE